jgi:HSP20 family protein
MPRRPVPLLEHLRREMGDMMELFFEPWPLLTEVEEPNVWAPRVDVVETDAEILLKVDLPGVDPLDVEVTVREGLLILRGEKKEERAEKVKTIHRIERFVGRFYRALPLPLEADFEKVAVNGAKGVLTITIPKKPEAIPRKVEVKAEA